MDAREGEQVETEEVTTRVLEMLLGGERLKGVEEKRGEGREGSVEVYLQVGRLC